jgi:hypothetical protein
MGVKAVYDTSSSRDLSLIEACNEFVSRYQKNQSSGQEVGANLPMISSACPGKILLGSWEHDCNVLLWVSKCGDVAYIILLIWYHLFLHFR